MLWSRWWTTVRSDVCMWLFEIWIAKYRIVWISTWWQTWWFRVVYVRTSYEKRTRSYVRNSILHNNIYILNPRARHDRIIFINILNVLSARVLSGFSFAHSILFYFLNGQIVSMAMNGNTKISQVKILQKLVSWSCGKSMHCNIFYLHCVSLFHVAPIEHCHQRWPEIFQK